MAVLADKAMYEPALRSENVINRHSLRQVNPACLPHPAAAWTVVRERSRASGTAISRVKTRAAAARQVRTLLGEGELVSDIGGWDHHSGPDRGRRPARQATDRMGAARLPRCGACIATCALWRRHTPDGACPFSQERCQQLELGGQQTLTSPLPNVVAGRGKEPQGCEREWQRCARKGDMRRPQVRVAVHSRSKTCGSARSSPDGASVSKRRTGSRHRPPERALSRPRRYRRPVLRRARVPRQPSPPLLAPAEISAWNEALERPALWPIQPPPPGSAPPAAAAAATPPRPRPRPRGQDHERVTHRVRVHLRPSRTGRSGHQPPIELPSTTCPRQARYGPLSGAFLEHQYLSRAQMEDAMNPALALAHQPLGFEQRRLVAGPLTFHAQQVDVVARRSARPDTGWAA